MRQWCNLGLAVISQPDPPSNTTLETTLFNTETTAVSQRHCHRVTATETLSWDTSLHCLYNNSAIVDLSLGGATSLGHLILLLSPMFALHSENCQWQRLFSFSSLSPFSSSSSVCYFSCWLEPWLTPWLASTKQYCLSQPPPPHFLLPAPPPLPPPLLLIFLLFLTLATFPTSLPSPPLWTMFFLLFNLLCTLFN